MAAVESVDNLHVLIKAQSLKRDQWIERILEQSRKGMVGIDANEYKDLSEKQHNALPNLTGSASHRSWEAAVFKLTGSLKDGKQLVHLTHVLSYLQDKIPLPAEFKTLPGVEFNMSTATWAQLEMRAEFKKDWENFVWSDFKDQIEGPKLGKLESEALTPSQQQAEDGQIPQGSPVEVLLHPPKGDAESSSKVLLEMMKEGSVGDDKGGPADDWMPG